MLSRISSPELSEWMAFAQVEPFGEERADIRAAIIASTIANIWRGKNQKPFTITDFMPNFDPPRQQTVEEMNAVLRSIAGVKPKDG